MDCENALSDFSNELKEGLEEKRFTIDGIETLLIKTISTIKANLVATTEDLVNEAALKKK